MAKSPAFLFYPGDWLGGTMGMSFEEKGAYLELLVMQWNKGRISQTNAKRVVGEDLWLRIAYKFECDGDGFFNKRLEVEKQKRIKHTEKQSINSKKRWSSGNAIALPLENANLNGNVNEVKDRGVGEELVYDAEKEILKNTIWFEQISMNSGKGMDESKESLRKFHLYMEENSKYPRTKRAICAGFEKWLLNEKKTNGSTTHQRTPQNGSGKKGTSDARIDALKNW